MKKKLLAAFVVFLVLFVLWAFYDLAFQASRGGQSMPLYSARRYDPYGAAALRDLLAERGLLVRPQERPRFGKQDRGVLIQVLPSPVDVLHPNALNAKRRPSIPTQRLLEWIAQGNTVVQFTRFQTPLMDAVGFEEPANKSAAVAIEVHQFTGGRPDIIEAYTTEGFWTEAAYESFGLPRGTSLRLKLRGPREFVHPRNADWQPLARTGSAVVAGELRHGLGRLIVIGAPTPALNNSLEEGQNLEFILHLVGDGPVLFDEWSHGVGRADTIIGLIQDYGLSAVLFQILFVVALYVWSVRGEQPIEKHEIVRGRSSSEQIKVLGHLYGRTLSAEQTRKNVHQEVLFRIATAFRCSPADVEARRFPANHKSAAKANRLIDTLLRLQTNRSRRLDGELTRLLTLSHEFLEENTHVRKRA